MRLITIYICANTRTLIHNNIDIDCGSNPTMANCTHEIIPSHKEFNFLNVKIEWDDTNFGSVSLLFGRLFFRFKRNFPFICLWKFCANNFRWIDLVVSPNWCTTHKSQLNFIELSRKCDQVNRILYTHSLKVAH